MSKLWTILGGRKFVILILSTGLLCLGKIDSWQWLIIAGLYIGVNLAQDWILKKKG
jgi:hypothetical protein